MEYYNKQKHSDKGDEMRYIKFFKDIGLADIGQVGGKNASLGEMVSGLEHAGVKVPNGFAITAEAYRLLLSENHLEEKIETIIADLDINDIKNLSLHAQQIRTLFMQTTLPEILKKEIIEAYALLSKEYDSEAVDVAVRSSGTAEDLPDASFAGQQETYLNVNTPGDLLQTVRQCFASLFTDRAISYRHSRGYGHLDVGLSVGVQKMVRSDLASSGVIFTIDTESGSDNVIMVNAIWGLGENIVGGKVTPDEFYVFKPTLKNGISTIIKRQLGSKEMKMVYSADETSTENIETTLQERESFSLSDEELILLAKYAQSIEEHYTQLAGEPRAMDIEWAKDGKSGTLYIVQARPETVQSKRVKHLLSTYKLRASENEKEVLITGISVGDKIGSGRTSIIADLSDAARFKAGDVLVADITDPDWEPLMKKASALVTNKGGRTCHAAIVAREIGIPAAVGCVNATEVLHEGMEVTVSCAEGEEGYVYKGLLKYEIEEIDLKDLKALKTKLFMNVGNPEKAFSFANLPNQGVGLARMEFIINNTVKCHPMALCDLQRGKAVDDEALIRDFMKGYADPKRFFVQNLTEGIGMIAAAFYPKPVIVRTSDFKSNEYKHMVGGERYEEDEENPMIGFRGASRYYSKEYQEAFEWECEALRIVRDEMGLDNVKIMLPFVRTPEEGRKVIAVMNEQGLVQGRNGLEIYAMCEIPSNVILADEFLKVFDGYSIGSNDLTQLTLGVDRDSALIAHIFDERNEAVKRMLKMAIDACKSADKYIGICGQAPSDYPEITEFLVENGIDSISLNPDSVLKMWQVVADLEARLS